MDAERALAGPRRPIVLLPRRQGAAIAEAVAPGTAQLGVMLPYTPLHHLLARRLRVPFVLTSGNVSDEPIAHDDRDALARLGPIAKFFLVHDRPIHVRTDDSVVRMFRGREMPVRRARGHAPQPVVVSHSGAPADPRLRRRAEEHLLSPEGPLRVRVAPRRRPRELRHHAGVQRGHPALPASVRRDAGARRPRSASRVPLDEVRPRLRWRRARRCPAPSRARGVLPGGQPRGGPRHRGRLRRPRLRDGRDPLGRRVPGGDAAELRARGALRGGAHARWHDGHPPAVADGGQLPRRRLRRRHPGARRRGA